MIDTDETAGIVPHAGVIIKLLQGTVFQEDKKNWNTLIAYQAVVRSYFEQIGVDLFLSESDGFAYLTQNERDFSEEKFPRLIKRIPLSYEVTILLVVLRETLEEFDNKTMYSSKCFITDLEIKEKIELMLKEKTDRVKLLNQLNSYTNKVVELGFLKEVKTDEIGEDLRRFEIRRVIRAKMNNEKLEEIKEKLTTNE